MLLTPAADHNHTALVEAVETVSSCCIPEPEGQQRHTLQ